MRCVVKGKTSNEKIPYCLTSFRTTFQLKGIHLLKFFSKLGPSSCCCLA